MADDKRPSSSAEALRKLRERRQPNGDNPAGSTRYEVVDELGRGGVGVVYRGKDLDLSRDVAMKVLHPEFADQPEVLERFIEEAQIGGQLQHPGIVPVYEIGLQHDDRPFFAMKLIKGETLFRLLSERRSLQDDRQRFLAAFTQVCQTVAYAHARQVVHRDLKPENVMVGSFGEVQVVDWGFAKVLQDGGVAEPTEARDPETIVNTVRTEDGSGSQSMLGSVLGTPAYMPREQALGDVEQMDLRSDVFGLGGILCEILTGHPPYRGSPQEALLKAARAELDDAHQRLDACGANETLVALCKNCLQGQPADRPESAQAVSDVMTGYLAAVEQRAREAEVKEAEARVRARATVWLSAAALLIVLLGGGGYVYLEQLATERTQRATEKVASARSNLQLALGEARSAGVEDTARWQRTNDAARQLRNLIDDDVAPTERNRVAELLQVVNREQAAATAAREQRSKDRNMQGALAAVFVDPETTGLGPIDSQRHRESAYRKLFAAYLDGHGIDDTPLADSAERIRSGRIATELAVALDDWAFSRRMLEQAGRTDVGLGSGHLRQLARRVDPDDPVRNRLRDMFAANEFDAASLQRLHADADLSTWSVTAILLLEHALWESRAVHDSIAAIEEGLQWHPSAAVLHARLAARWNELPDPEPELAMAALRGARAADPTMRVEYGIAFTMLHSNRDEEALRFCERELATRGESSPLLGAKAIALNQLGRFEQAETCFEQLIAQRGPQKHILTNLGNLMIAQGRLEEAAKRYEEALAIDPDYVNCLGNYATILDDLGDPERALAMAKRAVALDPLHAHGHEVMGTMLALFRDHEAAEASFQRSLELAPNQASTLNNYAKHLREIGRFEEAITYYRRAADNDPGNTLIRSNIIRLLCDIGRPQDGLDYLAEAESRIPPSAEVEVVRARCQLALGQQQATITTLLAASERFPENAGPHLELGRTLATMERFEEALKHLLHANELGHKSVDLHNNLSAIYRQLGQPDKGFEHAKLAVQTDPKHGPANFNLGMAYARRNDFEHAIEQMREARTIWSADQTTFGKLWYGKSSQSMAEMLLRLGKTDQALKIMRESVAHQPDNFQLRMMMADVFNQRGQVVAALGQQLKAVELRPDEAPAWINIADLRSQCGQIRRALVAAHKAQELFAAEDSAFARTWGSRARSLAQDLQTRIERAEALLPIARGERQAENADEGVMAAASAYALDEYALALRQWQHNFDTWPDDLDPSTSFYAAACVAAQASTESDLTPDQRTEHRALSLGWLERELARIQAIESPGRYARKRLAKRLDDLQIHPDLDPVREPAAVERLPVEQAAQGRKLWSNVAELLEAMR